MNAQLARGETGVRFEITNTSAEVNEEAKCRTFDRFYRAEGSRRREGFGLSLNIAHELGRPKGAKLELPPSTPGTTGSAVTFPAQP